MPLEGLFWADDMKVFMPELPDRNKWQWTLTDNAAGFYHPEDFENSVAASKKKKDNPLIDKVDLKTSPKVKQHKSLHIGPYSAEGRIFKSCITKLPESA